MVTARKKTTPVAEIEGMPVARVNSKTGKWESTETPAKKKKKANVIKPELAPVTKSREPGVEVRDGLVFVTDEARVALTEALDYVALFIYHALASMNEDQPEFMKYIDQVEFLVKHHSTNAQFSRVYWDEEKKKPILGHRPKSYQEGK